MTSPLENLESPPSNLPVQKEQQHLNYLDGIRALAALYVMVFHCIIHQHQLPTGRAYILTEWMMYGQFAVDVFIVVSGFSLMLPIVRGDGKLRGGPRGFLLRRARRILPPYYFALGITLLFSVTILGHITNTDWDHTLPITVGAVVTHVFLIHNLFARYMWKINTPFWSIAVEWQIYFLFPFLLWAWSRVGGLRATVLAIIVGYIGVIALHHTTAEGMTPQYIGLFALGMLGSAVSFSVEDIWTRLRIRLPWGLILVASAASVVLICRHFGGHRIMSTHSSFIDFFVGATSLCMLIVVSKSPNNWMRRLLSLRPLAFIGSFAYSIYLIHEPCFQILWIYLIAPMHLKVLPAFAVMVFFAIPIVVGIAYLFFLVCERPYLNSKPKSAVLKEQSKTAPTAIRA